MKYMLLTDDDAIRIGIRKDCGDLDVFAVHPDGSREDLFGVNTEDGSWHKYVGVASKFGFATDGNERIIFDDEV